MRPLVISTLRVATLGVFLGLFALPVLGDTTARSALKEVVAAGTKWQPDSILTHVSTLDARGDGKARTWLYTFYSPRNRKSAIVTARNGKVEIEPDVRTTSVDPVGEFIDSDKALDAARKQGLRAEDSIAMGITLMGRATAQPRVLWSITVMGDSILSWSIDSKDGTLVHRNEVKLK